MQFEKSFAGISYSKTLCKQVIVWIFYIKLGLSYIDFFNGARKIRTKVIIQINVGKHYFRDSLQNLHIFLKMCYAHHFMHFVKFLPEYP